MTFTISKFKLAAAIVAAAMLIPATALATHVFDDVPDEKFYADPVEWAANNSITTGKSPTTFAPDDNVTRGEAVTFLKRYHDNVAEPGIDAAKAAADANETDIATNTAAIAALPDNHWVTLNSDGSIAMATPGVNTDAAETRRLGDGLYEVDFFVDDVSSCFAMVSLTNTRSTADLLRMAPYAVRRSGDDSSFWVVTRADGKFDYADSAFTLQLYCPGDGAAAAPSGATRDAAADTYPVASGFGPITNESPGPRARRRSLAARCGSTASPRAPSDDTHGLWHASSTRPTAGEAGSASTRRRISDPRRLR